MVMIMIMIIIITIMLWYNNNNNNNNNKGVLFSYSCCSVGRLVLWSVGRLLAFLLDS